MEKLNWEERWSACCGDEVGVGAENDGDGVETDVGNVEENVSVDLDDQVFWSVESVKEELHEMWKVELAVEKLEQVREVVVV